MALPDLTGQQIQDTYQRVLQTDGSILYDGTGSIINILPITASHALTASYAVSASHEIIKEVSSSFADTASYVTPLNQDVTITGNVGIGTTSPSYTLDVRGSGRFTDVLTVQNIQITTGSNNTNTGVGYQALQENIGVDSNGFGYQALFSNQEDGSNGFGYQALYNNRGSYSNGFGYLALYNNTGVSAAGFGDEVLYNNTGDYACGFGPAALSNNTVQRSNGFGYLSLYNNSGINSNGFGYESLRNNKGDDVSGFGYQALYNNSGSNNTAIGNNAAYESGYLTGNNNTFLGYNASYGENTTIENSTAVGANITLTDSNTVILGNNTSVGIGTTSPSSKLHVSGSLLVEAGTDTPYIKGSQLRIPSQTNGAFGTLRLGSVNDIVGDVGNYQFKNGSTTLMTIKNTGNVGMGTTSPDASAILDIASTTKGVVFPRMTSAQRTAISSPTTGLIVYQTDSTEGLYIYKSTGWVQII